MIIKKINQYARYCIGFLLLLLPPLAAAIDDDSLRRALAEERAALSTTYDAHYTNTEIANLIKAQFHHALLAMDDKAGYFVLSLDSTEIAYLESIGFSIQPALTYRQQRLEQLQAALTQGQALPAWGQQAMCDRCNNAGICRRQIWST